MKRNYVEVSKILFPSFVINVVVNVTQSRLKTTETNEIRTVRSFHCTMSFKMES